MYSQKYGSNITSRQAPGIFTYMELVSSRVLAYTIFFGLPFLIALFSMILNAFFSHGSWDLLFFLEIVIIFMTITCVGEGVSLLYYKRAPVLGLPPKGWSIHFNAFFTGLIGGSFLIGQLTTLYTGNIAFQEIFFILGSIIAYIMAFTIYFSFTTITKFTSYLLLALTQPIIGIILYSQYTAQFHLSFFLRAMIFFSTCALLFLIPYARGMFHVSSIYKKTTGLGGYGFIRAFVLSMLTEGNDSRIETFFDNIGVKSNVKIQYLLIRSKASKNLKGLFIAPNVHFGPFKTCGSSDLPEHIYRSFRLVPGTTVYHTTNTHTQNLTSQREVNKVLKTIEDDVNSLINDPSIKWTDKMVDFSRKISNSAKLIGTVVGSNAIAFVTRHPLPSDDIQADLGKKLHKVAIKEGYSDLMLIDSHNSIIGDEITILKESVEAKDIIDVTSKFLDNNKPGRKEVNEILYGVASDPIMEFDEKDGIGYGGMVVHLFKNKDTGHESALIHLDANNAYADIRSFILNMLQNRGIEKGEVTTSDSHTVARQFTSRGYSPIGDKIKLDFLLGKIDMLLRRAKDNLEPVEICYHASMVEEVRIWGDDKYFDVIIDTLQECIKVSQRLLTYSLFIPSFFSLLLLLFYYNVPIIFNP